MLKLFIHTTDGRATSQDLDFRVVHIVDLARPLRKTERHFSLCYSVAYDPEKSCVDQSRLRRQPPCRSCLKQEPGREAYETLIKDLDGC